MELDDVTLGARASRTVHPPPESAENLRHLGKCLAEGGWAFGAWPTRGACQVIHDRDASFTLAFDDVFMATGARVIRSAVQAPRMNSIMERWIGNCRRELLDRTLIWNHRHLMTVLREYEDFHNTHRPHRSLKQAAPMRPLPETVTDIDHFRVRRRDRVGGVIHEYRLVA
jgi:putative transposase